MDDDERDQQPMLELSVTVWNTDHGSLLAVVRMGKHELAAIEGTDLRDVMVATGRTLTRAV